MERESVTVTKRSVCWQLKHEKTTSRSNISHSTRNSSKLKDLPHHLQWRMEHRTPCRLGLAAEEGRLNDLCRQHHSRRLRQVCLRDLRRARLGMEVLRQVYLLDLLHKHHHKASLARCRLAMVGTRRSHLGSEHHRLDCRCKWALHLACLHLAIRKFMGDDVEEFSNTTQTRSSRGSSMMPRDAPKME